MRKTIIALMAMGACVLEAADSITLSSKLTYTDAENPEKNFTISAYDTFVNQTRTYIDGYKYNGIDCIDGDRQNSIGGTITLNLGQMFMSGADTLPSHVAISEVSIIGRDSDDRRPENVTLTLSIDGVSYVSDAATYERKGNEHGVITFCFREAAPISSLGDIVGTISDGTSLGSGCFKAENGAVLAGVNTGKLDTKGEIDWAPVAKVTLTVPEPTTATLSLLALAGLAARRRRR